jgi:hypothetical protein
MASIMPRLILGPSATPFGDQAPVLNPPKLIHLSEILCGCFQ